MEKVRQKIVARIKAGDNPSVIARNLGISRTTVYNAMKLYNETESFVDRPRSGRPKSVRTESLIRSVKAKIDVNPRDNIRQMARELRVHETAVRRIVKEDLGFKSRAVTKVQSLTALYRQKKEERSKILLNKLKKPNRTRSATPTAFGTSPSHTKTPLTKQNSLCVRNTQSMP
ncbi:uncharacterized protein [Lepeophtheirus salmonis]|uniref:uncharacterized protein n=1 Tax=Lepeophtheirus salmonis TaxID=72036 RepID=UPI001AE25FBD|nr:uncharacterized protein LOC121117070 [Lepeophtheirus salmonis]